MTGLTITSNTTAGYNLNNTADNPVMVASGVTITDANWPALFGTNAAILDDRQFRHASGQWTKCR